MFYDVCKEAIPSILNQLVNELIVALQVQSDISVARARLNVITQWQLGRDRYDLNPFFQLSGSPRYGFELNPNDIPDASPDADVSAYLLSASNQFSFLNYQDPSDVSSGYNLWKRIMVGDMEAVQIVKDGILEEIDPGPSTEQIFFVAKWLNGWITNDITKIDRQKQWRVGKWGTHKN